jgi:dipeptide/tripeptide permease
VTRLAPVRYGAMMMGMWFLVANAFGNKIAGSAAGYMDEMGPKQLFIVVTLILAGATVILPFLIPWLRKQMAGVK